MNWQNGLERMSAVWWGFWALVCGASGIGILIAGDGERALGAGLLFIGVPALYAMHRLTCWVLAGFFSPR